MDAVTTTTIHLDERGFVPNNPRLPLLVYVAAFPPATTDLATVMEKRFHENGWPPQWRNGVYDFHHYHTKGHEVLGIAAGHATLMLGGERGRELKVGPGDVLLLPAGTGHCRISASGDFLVIGAYPPGQEGDIVREAPSSAIRQAIAKLSFPATDPVYGRDGPLSRHWSEGV